MMKNLILISSTVLLLIAYVSGHARLMQPVSRGSAFRVYPSRFPVVEQDDTFWCRSNNPRVNTSCGICGPIYYNDVAAGHRVEIRSQNYDEMHYSFEKGGPYYTGEIVESYKKGQEIEVRLRIKAGHRGFFQFRLCNADGIDNPDNECFKGNALRFRDYKKRTPQLTYKEAKEAGRIVPTTVYDRDGSTFVENQQAYYLQLPDDVTCKHCILQWRWKKTKSRQTYYGCSDISITD